MNMEFTHQPNYFFFAHRLVQFLEGYLRKHPETDTEFNLQSIEHDVFGDDRASSSVNLEGILNIADEYQVHTERGVLPLIRSYMIQAEKHVLKIQFHPESVRGLSLGELSRYPNVH
ncbi:hypothetical protein [Acinetobacter sp. MD2(2019)]|uniref:hypothetical protein n=1 Tax=Acinetobacter sp. MD2(2019) TaxID=2605273 RepID=UPI002D1EF69F|nr:hypothetical protein [Acinetobacter sp. MD2(2019)]MEB3754873.1 hypothetical protein [Acinetobacter sp. MD2(2019)]